MSNCLEIFYVSDTKIMCEEELKKSFEKLKHEIEENRSQYDELKIYYGKKDNCTLDGLEEYLLNEE